jgi:steroid delta-isomerase-like uncharacterized protein
MAESDNIKHVHQQITALNAHEIDRYLQGLDESYVGESETSPGPVQGREGARQSLNIMLTGIPDLRIEVEQIIASGDHVVTRARVEGTHTGTLLGIAPTNKSVSWQACIVVEIRNGKTLRSRIYADNLSLFRQLGVIQVPKATAAG